jgi:hypothetical protein
MDWPLTWIPLDEKFYGGTILRHSPRVDNGPFHDRDLLADLEKPCAERGIKIYARLLEGWRTPGRLNFEKVFEVDARGIISNRPCYRNPDYINFHISTVQHMFVSYPFLAGYYYGSENSGPLGQALNGGRATCFCPHCCANARENGIDPERARQGYLQLEKTVAAMHAGEEFADGAFITIMRLLIEFPEIMAWEREWTQSYNNLSRLMQGQMKYLNKDYELGYHADNAVTGTNIWKRVGFGYDTMSEFYDWIKPCAYRMATAPRMSGQTQKLNQSLLGDLDPREAMEFIYRVNGYDPAVEPTMADYQSGDLSKMTLSEGYMRREIERAVKSAKGRCKIYSGVAVGIPVLNKEALESPEFTYRDCTTSLEAGADGFLISREYDEIPMENLKAIGQAISDWEKAR